MAVRNQIALSWFVLATLSIGCAAPNGKSPNLLQWLAKNEAAPTEPVRASISDDPQPGVETTPAPYSGNYRSKEQQVPTHTALAVPPPKSASATRQTAHPERPKETEQPPVAPQVSENEAASAEEQTEPPDAPLSEPATIAEISHGKAFKTNLKLTPDRIAPPANSAASPPATAKDEKNAVAAGKSASSSPTNERKQAPATATPPANAVTNNSQEEVAAASLAILQKILKQVQTGKSLSHSDIMLAAANTPTEYPPLNAELSLPPNTAPPLKEAPAGRESPSNEDAPDEEISLTEIDELRHELITRLEQTIRKKRSELTRESRTRYEQELRLAYLAADRLDDATQKIETLPAAAAESYRHLLFALAQLTPTEEDKKPAHRNARVLKALRDAAQELSSASRLELRNLAFCESVEQFGWYNEFKRREFVPGQQVLLYVEVENVTSERKGPQQFETELHGSYQLFDVSGKLVAERTLPVDKESCRNWRRDYFLAYRIYLPDSISPGNYRLELEIEDVKGKSPSGGKKLGEGLIEFVVK